jgi:hypothetical protein
MTNHASFERHLAYLAGTVLARASETVLGVLVIIAGLALTITVYLMPVGAFLILLGVILFITGSDATGAVWIHLREDYGARHHVSGTHDHQARL